jgi:hypothetical protein
MKKVLPAVVLWAVAVSSVAIVAVNAQSRGSFATVGLTSGWNTFGLALPEGAARNGLRVGTLVTQTDIKNRWPDGSIRFAVVTVRAAANGTFRITAGESSSATIATAIPEAAVAFSIGSATYTASLPRMPSRDVWLTGPVAYEWRWVVAPATATGTTHPFLRVVFDTRVFSDGTGRVDTIVENVLDQAGAETVTYDVTITVDKQQLFARRVQHFYLTRWRKTFEVGPSPFGAVTPDLTPFHLARALPPYLKLVAKRVSRPEGPTYDILSSGALNPNMPEHGGRPELAPYPDWTARYLVHTDANDRRFVLANGDLSGSWPIHVREADGSSTPGVGSERLVSLDQRPRLWYDERARGDQLDYIKGRPLPLREYGSTTPGPGQTSLIPDTAHQPSLAFVPYLLTGDRYYAEEMAFWANYSMMRTYPMDGVRGSHGILAYNEVRGYGWALRNLADAAAYYPEASPVRAYLAQKVIANLQWLDKYARDQITSSNPLGFLWIGKRPEANFVSLWEQSYLAFAIDRANRHGFSGGLVHRDAIARLQLRLFTSEPQYPRDQGAPYVVAAGTSSLGRFTFFTTMEQVWPATKGQERAFPGYYGPEARLILMVGVESGWPGAKASYDYLWPFIGQHPFIDGIPDLARRAGWAVDFSPTASSAKP